MAAILKMTLKRASWALEGLKGGLRLSTSIQDLPTVEISTALGWSMKNSQEFLVSLSLPTGRTLVHRVTSIELPLIAMPSSGVISPIDCRRR